MQEHEHSLPMWIGTPDGPKWILATFKHHHAMPGDLDDHWHGVYIGGGTNAMTNAAISEIFARTREAVAQSPAPGLRGTRKTKKL